MTTPEDQVNTTMLSRLNAYDQNLSRAEMELVLQSTGDLCYENAHKLVEAVEEMLTHRPERITVDLGDHGMIDSSGIRALLQSRALCNEVGTAFILSSISECAARIIKMSGFEQVFELDAVACRPVHTTAADNIVQTVSGSQQFEFVAMSDPAVVPVLREKVAQAAADAGASGDVLCDIKIAVGEALTNAYKHGSRNKGTDKITVRCATDSSMLEVEIEDQGVPFNPEDTPAPNPKDMKPHGMGIYLMRQTMDRVEFAATGSGNLVKMIKRW